MNVEDFGGIIEIDGCTIEKNMHYIPSIYYKHRDIASKDNSASFLDLQNTLEYKL